MNVAIIPARSGSKRIKKKNIKIFYSKPMIYWTIKKIQDINLFDKICVTSDSNEILNIAKKYGVQILIKRPKKISDDKTPTQPVICHAIDQLDKMNFKTNMVCCVYPCNPFLQSKDLKKAFKLSKNNYSNYIFPIAEYSHPIQRALKINANNLVEPFNHKNTNKRTQDLVKAYYDSGQFYLASKEVWKSKKNIHSNGISIIIPNWRVVDIDNENDWKKAELMFKNFKYKWMTTTVVCHDAGGAELISNYVINKKNINFVIRGPAKKIFQNNIKNFKNISFIKAIKKSKIVICGTSAFSDLEKKTIKKCKEKNIKVVSWIDNWTNYEKRFLLDGKLILPDEIWVSDIRAYKKIKKIFPNIAVIKKKNFYFANLKKKIRKKTHKKKEKILYICGLLNGKNPINKLDIMKVLVKYKVTDAFGKNFNDWLRDTFGNIITK